MRGQQLSLKVLVINGFDKPIQIETKDGLEIVIDPDLHLNTIQNYYGPDFMVDVTEVTRQANFKIRLDTLIEKFTIPSVDRHEVFTAKLDLTLNKHLNESCLPPRIVRKLSWVDQCWPDVPLKPSVSKHCFISMQNSFINFHILNGGASSWYHIIEGEQIFYLIEPTESNLKLFQDWICSDKSSEQMFFKKSDRLYKIKVNTGETLFIPNGWIHAVMTTEDTLALGGYFLHSLSIASQLKINDFLLQLNKPELLFPSFELTNWYAAPNILKLIKENFKNRAPKHLSEGIIALIDKLRSWLHKSKSKRKENLILVPKALDCSKIIRDLNRCLQTAKPKSSVSSNETKVKEKSKSVAKEPEKVTMPLDLEDAKIKDLVTSSDKGDHKSAQNQSSNLKLTLNMKLAQDVIRSEY